MAAENFYKLWIRNANEIVRIRSEGKGPKLGAAMRDVAVLKNDNGAGLSLLVDKHGKIAAIGTNQEIETIVGTKSVERTINANGMCILPGFVDAHTHPVFAGDRVHEFAMKLAGATYMDVMKAGGGILFTVEKTKKATEEELFESFKFRAQQLLQAGTTLMEAKSGYGLDLETEMKQLRVLTRARRELPIGIVSTYLAAHAVPKGLNVEQQTEDITGKQIRSLKAAIDNGSIECENIDVFCEKGIFECDQTERILEAGRQIGLQLNFHAEELNYIGGAELGARLKAKAMSHLEEISDTGISAMAESGTAAVLLPTTAFMLRLKPPPARKMIEAGCIVALGSDFNPNAYCFAMPIVMHLACILLRISMEEALVAATLHSAISLGKEATHGSLQVGKMADLIVLNAPSWEHVIYQLGNYNQLIRYVIKSGEVVHAMDEGAISSNQF